MAEWFNAPVLKTGDPPGSVGSNPTPSAQVDFQELRQGYRLLQEQIHTVPQDSKGCQQSGRRQSKTVAKVRSDPVYKQVIEEAILLPNRPKSVDEQAQL